MNILVIAPHCDDEILGVGGTIAKHIANGDAVYICVVANHDVPLYPEGQKELIQREAEAAHAFLGVKEVINLGYKAVLLNEIPRWEVNKAINDVVVRIKPEVIYMPHIGDIHIDHQLTAMASLVAVRPIEKPYIKAVYVYETLSETEWNAPNTSNAFIPNVYSDITDFIENKVTAMEKYVSQLKSAPNARSIGSIRALAQYRGSAIGVLAAEAFMLVRERM
jgi:LmbE family N-acetylglucosaminyl deacetylase